MGPIVKNSGLQHLQEGLGRRGFVAMHATGDVNAGALADRAPSECDQREIIPQPHQFFPEAMLFCLDSESSE
jgi:hypothetical protein